MSKKIKNRINQYYRGKYIPVRLHDPVEELTVEQWFNKCLPRAIAMSFIETTKKLSGTSRLTQTEYSLKEAMLGAFDWEKADNEDYVRYIYKEYAEKEEKVQLESKETT